MGRAAAPGQARLQPVRVSLFDADGGHVGSVALSDIGDYVAVADMPTSPTSRAAEEIADEVERPGTPGRMRLYNGLYEAALKNQVPTKIIDEMVRIVSYDVDFNRPVGPTDSFEVFYSDPNEPRRRRRGRLYGAQAGRRAAPVLPLRDRRRRPHRLL